MMLYFQLSHTNGFLYERTKYYDYKFKSLWVICKWKNESSENINIGAIQVFYGDGGDWSYVLSSYKGNTTLPQNFVLYINVCGRTDNGFYLSPNILCTTGSAHIENYCIYDYANKGLLPNQSIKYLRISAGVTLKAGMTFNIYGIRV